MTRHLVGMLLILGVGTSAGPAFGALGCALDVDGSGVPPDVATDIVYFARTLLGLPAVPASFRALDPNIPPDSTIAANVAAIGSAADVDTSGAVDVATDLVYIARHLTNLPAVPTSFRTLLHTIAPDTVIAARSDDLCPALNPNRHNVYVADGGLRFNPSSLTIPVGDTVHWVWVSSGHTVVSGTSCTADNKFCSPSDTSCAAPPALAQGATYDHVFSAPGMFPYYCSIHCAFGMVGTITAQ